MSTPNPAAGHGGGLVARIWLDADATWRDLANGLHQALAVDLAAYRDTSSDDEYLLRGEVLGHTLIADCRRRQVDLALAPSGAGLPGAPRLDVSAALATVLVDASGGAWRLRACGVPDLAHPRLAALSAPGDPKGWGGGNAPVSGGPAARGLAFDVEFETPPSHLARDVGPAGVRLTAGFPGVPLATRFAETMRLPWIVQDLATYVHLWLADSPDAEGEARSYETRHLGMYLRLDLGTTNAPRHRLRGTPLVSPAGPDLQVLDVSEVMAALLYEVGGGMPARPGACAPYQWSTRALPGGTWRRKTR